MDNGKQPAFPFNAQEGNINETIEVAHYGLTKREFFAGQAMQGMLAGIWSDIKTVEGFVKAAKDEGNTYREEITERSFLIADAMLAEPETTGGK